MSIGITEVQLSSTRFKELGIGLPKGIAFLPRNFTSVNSADEFLHEELVPTLRKLFREHGINETELNPPMQLRTIHEKDGSLILPTVFISSIFLSNDPHAVTLTLALNIIGNYLSNFLHGTKSKDKQVKINILIENDPVRSFKKIVYTGSIDGLPEVLEIVKELNDGS